MSGPFASFWKVMLRYLFITVKLLYLLSVKSAIELRHTKTVLELIYMHPIEIGYESP